MRGAAESLLLLTGMRVHFDFVSATRIELPSVVERALGRCRLGALIIVEASMS